MKEERLAATQGMNEHLDKVADDSVMESLKPKKIAHNILSLNKRLEELESSKGSVTEQEGELSDDNRKSLFDRIHNLERCIAKMAVYNGGNMPTILREHGIEEYSLQESDLRRG